MAGSCPKPSQNVAVIVPLLNEIKALPSLTAALLRIGATELILVDGGSEDGSIQWVEQNQFENIKLVHSASGRAQQMNIGAAKASSEMLLFLHADTEFPAGGLSEIYGRTWGRFDIEFVDNIQPKYRVLDLVAKMINWRSRVSGVATGDQAMFVSKNLFHKVGGFPDIPIMEDVAISKLLKHHYDPHCSRVKVGTSARRWQQNGVVRTIILMWALRLAYFLGVPANRLKTFYSQVR